MKLLFAVAMAFGCANAAAAQPNFILILADDLGWSDLGCYGNTFNETPHIDRLAREGVRFTQFYAGPVCSPTRANLQSGQDQARFGITQHIPGHRRPFARLLDPVVPSHLPLEVETFAERLQAADYATGYLGKWHLGTGEHGPGKQGWQTVVETKGNTLADESANQPEKTARQRTAGFLTDRAVEFIREHASKPFVLQVSHHAVHIPLSTTAERLAKYQAKQPMPGYPSLPAYAGLLEELDESVGRIVAAVDEAGLAKQTLIVFVSDNGGLEHEQSGRVVTSNKPLRGEKGTLYEGGIRVPAIARWLDQIPKNGVCETQAITIDLFPTFLELAAMKAPANQPCDGVSLARLLREPTHVLKRSSLYWHLPHYHHSTPASAMRRGDWKLIEFFETRDCELYDLSRDPSEQHDLATKEPQRVTQLRDELHAWQKQVGAKFPVANPNYDPANPGGRESKQPSAQAGEK